MRSLRLLPLLAMLALLFTTCSNDATAPEAGEAEVEGVVSDAVSGAPIPGVTVASLGPVAAGQSARTDDQGQYSLKFALEDSSAMVAFSVTAAGYRDTVFTVRVDQGVTVAKNLVMISTRLTGPAVVFGLVSDGQTGNPLAALAVGAQVVSPVQTAPQSVVTNLVGEFKFVVTVDTTSIVRLTLVQSGYRDTLVYVKATPGTISYAVIAMHAGVAGSSGGGGGTGLPQTIAFLGAVPAELSVFGVGGQERSILTWEVRDSLGNPVDGAHAAQLTFTIVGGPGGGEYVSPQTIGTSATGRASMTFNAGTRAGVAQVVASTVAGGRSIISAPVRLVITGGYPDQAHFTIATPAFNFPALGTANKRHQINVLVGDKYSNPAAPSAVYFRTSAGVIQGTFGAAVTTKDGQGSVDLISGNPAPLGSASAAGYGDGYHYVVARTVGQNGAAVQDSLLLLWSGEGMILGVAPTSFDIPNRGGQSISFRVEDYLGHPLAQGTKISVTASIPPPPMEGQEQNKVFLQFGSQGSVELPDVIVPGPGSTQFTMSVQDGSWGIVDSVGTPVTVTITVTGPNTPSPISTSILGVVH